MLPMREFDTEELKTYNGKDGNPAYIARAGTVYDVTNSRLWHGGTHMLRHEAGRDLTAELSAAPHGPEMLERCPRVGVYRKKEEAPRPLPTYLSRLLQRFPFLRRHPHPMFVHFPIAFMTAAAVFMLLYRVTGRVSFELTALHCLGAGIICIPPAMATGYFTWWLNYLARPMRPVIIKQRLSLLMFCLCIIAFVWRLTFPASTASAGLAGFIYLCLVLCLFPLVAVTGWLGAGLTFPLEKTESSTGKAIEKPEKG